MRLTCESGDNDDDELIQMLIDFNMCIQTLLPKKHEEYPDEKVDMVMRTMRAPSVTIYENATIILEHIAKLELYGHTNKKKLGTFKATSTVQINVNSSGEIIKAKLTLPILTLTDIGTDVKSGSDQEFLDTLTGLVKGNVPEPVNKKLEKGCKLDFPPGVGGIPIRVLNPEVNFVSHAVHIKSNFELYSVNGSSPIGASEPCK